MNSKPSKNFDQIKPFLRMLEGSIDDARRRRLGDDSVVAPPAPVNRNGNAAPGAPQPTGNPIPLQGNQPMSPAAQPAEPDRPLRATPIKPKQSLHPSAGFRPTGS